MEHSNCGTEILSDHDEIFGEDVDEELKVGRKVYSDDEAYNLYNNYALRKGFSIRKGHLRKDVSGNIRQREFLCSKEGVFENENSLTVRKLNRLETRTGCKAMVRFNVKDDIWTISHIISDHNHDLAKAEERQFLRSGRKIIDAHASVISSMVDAGIRPTKSYFYLANEVGGAENIGFTKKDVQNYLQRKKNEMMEAGDGQSLLNHFKRKQGDDPNFFYSMQLDQFSRMTNFFWRDSRSKLDYECFGDVVCFDTTFRTNKYNLYCAPFVGVNHHWKNVLFGCSFLLDQSTESFVWLFESFLEAMGNKEPTTIFTDEDKAIAKAIKIVFPRTRHRLCTWHIAKKAKENLGCLFANPEFKKHFNKCFNGCKSETEFEASWDEMINELNLGDQPWLKKLYSLRDKWCPAFSLDSFSANMRSTQRSESTNNIFHQISTKTMKLIKFVHHYEKKIEEMRLAELEDDFRCKNGVPRLRVRNGMLSHGANVYTIKLFSFFEKELLGCITVRVKEVCHKDEVYAYDVFEEAQQRLYRIEYNPVTLDISCSCKLFESMGILCRHALRVFDLNNFTSLPTQYILKRWTKDAKKGIVWSNNKSASISNDPKSARLLRLSELMHEGRNVYGIASLSDCGTKIVKEMLVEAMKRLEKDLEVTNMLNNLKKMDEQSNDSILPNQSTVLNPPIVRAQMTKSRLKSSLEKRKKKATKGKCSQETSNVSSHRVAPPQMPILNPSTYHFGLSHHPIYNQGNLNWHFGHPNSQFSNAHMPHLSHLSQDSSSYK